MSTEEIDQNLEELKEHLPDVPLPISINYISNAGSQFLSRVLIENDDFQRMYDKDYPIRFNEPVYIKSIRLYINGSTKGFTNKLKLIIKDIKGKPIERSLRDLGDGSLKANIGFLSEEINISGVKNKLFSNSIQIKKIEIYGYSEIDTLQICQSIDKVLEIKSTIDNQIKSDRNSVSSREEALANELKLFNDSKESLNEHIKDLNNELSEKIDKVDEISSVLEKKHIELSGVEQKVSESTIHLGSLKHESERVDDVIEEKRSEKNDLIEENRKLKLELKELQGDKSLFTDEIREYANRGDRDARLYFLLAILPMTILLSLTINLYNKAQEIVDSDLLKSDVEMLDIILSRLPYTALSLSIIATCFTVCMIFVGRLIKIHQDRLDLSKVSIIARDVSDSSLDKMNIDDEEVEFSLRNKLKMDILKAHLSKDLGKEYEFRPDLKLPYQKKWKYFEAIRRLMEGDKKIKKEVSVESKQKGDKADEQ